MDDEALMGAFVRGDHDAFDTLFSRHAAPLYGFLLRKTKNEALAADLTQVTFLSIVRSRGRFGRNSKFRPWMYTIAMNALRDYWRRHKREVVARDNLLKEGDHQCENDVPNRSNVLHAALLCLPETQRVAVVMHQVLGYGFGEIGEALGIKPSAAKVRAHRGYLTLRRLLEGDG